ncbi:maestro heat-like repeat family member 5 [Prinia subflava]|uniref:maestro heat-like repeat family member 5 n=1 Tax=Prinia subflava TaxID=208062 RepID=UPI002FE1AFCE
MLLFRTLVTVPVDEEKMALKTHVHQSLLPLFFHCHDENQDVAEASWETLLFAAEFLKRKDIEKLVRKKKLWKFSECLLEGDRSRAAEHLRRVLPYLENAQEPLRAAAIRFLGVAGRSLRRQRELLQLIYKALEDMADNINPAISSLAIETFYILQDVDRSRYSIFENLQDQLHRAWRTRPRLSGLSWLRCWSSAQH